MHVTFLGKLEWRIAQIVTKAMVGSECESVGGGIVCIRLMRALLPGGVTCHLLDTNNDSPLPRARDAALVAAMRGMWRRYAASV